MLAGVGGTLIAGQPTPERLLPVDEGRKDRSFDRHRTRLIEAAKGGRLADVRTMLVREPSIYDLDLARRNEPSFDEYWKLDKSPQPFFDTLRDVLEHGGRFTRRGDFGAPYWYSDFPGEADQVVEHAVIIRESAPVFSKPDTRGQPIERLSYAVIKNAMGPPGFFTVSLRDGQKAYVRESDVRLPSGPRAYFRKIDTWKLIAFTEGMD
jgi:hypothetical protein